MRVMRGELRLEARDQFRARQRAIMVGIIFEEHAGIAAVIILVARLFRRAHPGRRLAGPAAASQCESAKRITGKRRKAGFPYGSGQLNRGGRLWRMTRRTGSEAPWPRLRRASCTSRAVSALRRLARLKSLSRGGLGIQMRRDTAHLNGGR